MRKSFKIKYKLLSFKPYNVYHIRVMNHCDRVDAPFDGEGVRHQLSLHFMLCLQFFILLLEISEPFNATALDLQT
jgi:hypothetical protein